MATEKQIAANRRNALKAGRPKGRKDNKTLEKEKMLRIIEQRYMAATDQLVNSRLSLARGQQFLFRIDKKEIIGPKGGLSYQNLPPKLVTEAWEIEEYISGLVQEGDHMDEKDPGAAYYYITTKEPVNMALDSIENRIYGKPKESLNLDVNVKFSLKGLADRRRAIELGNSHVKVLE